MDYTVDSKEHRVGYIGEKESNLIPTNNRMVDIAIFGSLPILAGDMIDKVTKVGASQIDGVNCFVENVIESDNHNILIEVIDNKVTDRYKFLGKANSAIYSGLFVDLYYDKKYRDIIIIPDLRTFGTGDNATFYNNDRRTIRGYSVGYGVKFNDDVSKSFSFPLNMTDNDGIDEPNKLTKIRSILVSLYGLENNSMASLTYIEKISGLDGYFNHGVSSEKGAPIQLLELELNSAVFNNPETKVNTYNLIQQNHAELRVDFVGKQKISKIVIPISF